MSRELFGQRKAQGIEVVGILLLVAQCIDSLFEEGSDAVNARGNVANTLRTMPYSIHSRHRGQQSLSGTDVRGGLLTFDMLLTGLQSHAVAEVTIFILTPSNDAARHVALVLVASSEIGCRRATIKHGDTETLRATKNDISAPLTRRRQQSKTEDIGSNGHLAIGCVGLLNKGTVVIDATIGIWELHHAGKEIGGELQLFVAACAHLYALWNGTGVDYGQRLSKYTIIYKDHLGTSLLLCTAAQTKHHRNGFGSGSCLIEERAVGQRHTRQIGNNGLEVHQCL